jgi:uncharacterized membrane-anchored protein
MGFLVIALISQLVVFASIINKREAVLRKGAVLRFNIQPVDPFDAFRGQYVSLWFRDAQNCPTTNTTERLERGQRIYVRFEAGTNGISRPVEASAVKPDWDGGIWLKTRARWNSGTDVSFDFPIDRYYTDEKTAPKIEGLVSFRSRGVVSNACAVVRAYKGSMLLEDLEFNGVPALEYIEACGTRR